MSVPPSIDPQSGKAAEAWTIGALLTWAAQHLAKKGSESPRLDAEVLLAHALGCRRIDLYTRYDEIAPEDARGRFRELVRQRIEGCPVAYLVGRKEFFALDLEVSRDVLIPRPESEFVVMECLRLAKAMPEPRILDIGTGSGNIAVTVAQQHKGGRVIAVDLSPAALAVAGRNAFRHGVADRVQLLAGDLFAPLPAGARFDFILSNPPYIARPDIPQLPIGVRDYEPHLALDGGPLGYAVFDRLIDQAREYLQPGGYLILEIGAPQEQEARRRLGGYTGYELAPTVHDYSGHPRVLRARWQP